MLFGGTIMKLYIKQKVFSWRDKFAVWDERERERWFAQGEIFTWGRKLRVYDAEGREAAFIRRKLLSLTPRYHIEIDGNTYALVKEFALLKPRFRLENTNWTMGGDFWAHEYETADGSERVMRMSKCWFAWGDSYELDIPRPENELLALCVALAVDCMNADASSARSSGGNH
jgi:uncharacterized protein YxjI